MYDRFGEVYRGRTVYGTGPRHLYRDRTRWKPELNIVTCPPQVSWVTVGSRAPVPVVKVSDSRDSIENIETISSMKRFPVLNVQIKLITMNLIRSNSFFLFSFFL